MSDIIGDVDVEALRGRAKEIRELLPPDASTMTLRVFAISVPIDQLKTLLECYERMTGVKCRACGADQSRHFCHCENDE